MEVDVKSIQDKLGKDFYQELDAAGALWPTGTMDGDHGLQGQLYFGIKRYHCQLLPQLWQDTCCEGDAVVNPAIVWGHPVQGTALDVPSK